jgi:hypothetical protein
MIAAPGSIILLGRSCDRVLQYLCAYLVDQKVGVVFIDQDQIGVGIKFDSSYWYLPGAVKLAHSDVAAVFNRSASFIPGADYSKEQRHANCRLWGLLDYEYDVVLNRPASMMSNGSKPYQSYLVRNFGLKLPRYSCFANIEIDDVGEDVIFKSISSTRSIVKQFAASSKRHVTEPVLFQEHIKGDNIRVHVVLDKVVAILIKSDIVDYRYNDATVFKLYRLPMTIETACISIAKFLGMGFCGIDLILAGEDYYFLEANPAPGYNYFEEKIAGFPISESLASVMLSGELL